MALTQKQLTLLNSCPILKEFKDWFIAIDNENEPQPIKKYYFKSYGDSSGEKELSKGVAKTTGVTDNGYSQIVVVSNEIFEEFVGNKYWIISTAKTDGTLYQLYEGAGTSGTGMYVEISTTRFEEE